MLRKLTATSKYLQRKQNFTFFVFLGVALKAFLGSDLSWIRLRPGLEGSAQKRQKEANRLKS